MAVKKDPLEGFRQLNDMNDLKDVLDRVEQELQGYYSFAAATIQLKTGEETIYAVYAEDVWWVKFGG